MNNKILNSIYDTRIEQLISITNPNEINKIRILNEIKELPLYPQKITNFLDFLISNIEFQSNNKQNLDYENSCSIIGCEKGNLTNFITNLIQENKRLEIMNSQNRLILLRQSNLIKKNEENKTDFIKNEFE